MAASFSTTSSGALCNLLKEQKTEVLRLLSSQHDRLTTFIQTEVGWSRGAPPPSGFAVTASDDLIKTSNEPARLPSLNTVDIDERSEDFDYQRRSTGRSVMLPDVPEVIRPSAPAPKIGSKRFLAIGDERDEPPSGGGSFTQPSLASLDDISKLRPVGSTRTRRLSRAITRAATFVPNVTLGSAGSAASRKSMLFVNAQQMTEEMKRVELAPERDNTKLFKREGLCQALVRNFYFDCLSFMVLFANTVWLGIEIDYNHAPHLGAAPVAVQVMEHLFCIYFVTEIFIRYGAFERTIYCIQDMWFIFDAVVVALMVTETWILLFVCTVAPSSLDQVALLRAVRLARLTKCVRLVRLMRAFPELMILASGIIAASRAVIFVLLFMVIVLYVFGMLFVQLFRGTQMEGKFTHVGEAMWVLLLDGAFPDFAPLVRPCARVGWQYAALMLMFVAFTALVILNLLIAVTVNVVNVVASVENEKNGIMDMKQTLLDISDWEKDDEYGEPWLSDSHFNMLLTLPECKEICQKMKIDMQDLQALAGDVRRLEEEDKVSFYDFVELLLQLRGSNQAKVKDVVHLRKLTNAKLDALSPALESFEKALQHIIAGK